MKSIDRDDPATIARDRQDNSRVLLLTSGALLAAFGLGAAIQTVFVFRAERIDPSVILDGVPNFGTRLLSSGVVVLLVPIIAVVLRLHERRRWGRLAVILPVAAIGALLRYGLQLALGVYGSFAVTAMLAEVLSGFFVIVLSLFLGLAQADTRSKLRLQERSTARQSLRAAAALEALSVQELHVRREVAEGLHGTVQNRLVMLAIRLDSILDRWRFSPLADCGRMAITGQDFAELADIRKDLDQIRERDVREMSQLLHPAGIELGIGHAIRLLTQRIPATIETQLVIDEAVSQCDRIGVERRVVLVRAAEEAITNALRHGSASKLRIKLSLEAGTESAPEHVRLAVIDNGTGFGSAPVQWSGLARLAERAAIFGGKVTLADLAAAEQSTRGTFAVAAAGALPGNAGTVTGTRLTARIPVPEASPARADTLGTEPAGTPPAGTPAGTAATLPAASSTETAWPTLT